MQTVEIARDQWKDTLDEFSRRHRDALISVDVVGSSLGALPEICELPLVGITAEPGAAGTISISAARSVDDHLTHTIQAPTRVWIARSEQGNDAALEIESEDGIKTILRFESHARPKTNRGK